MKTTTYCISNDIAVTVHGSETHGRTPWIILCHGFCGIQEILLPAFAEAFAAAGFTSVTFDYRGFGKSGGERGRLVPAMQIEDIRTVIAWTKQQTAHDEDRIGLWGTSFGGCHVVSAAANNPDISCVVTQLPFADGETIVTGRMSSEEKLGFIATLDKMEAKRRDSGKEMFVGITRVLNDDESKAFFEAYKDEFPTMNVKIPFLTVRETLLYKPGIAAKEVVCPVLVVVAEKDTVNPPEQGQALFDAIGTTTKALHNETGARHYDVYSGAHFDNVVAAEISWFKKHLQQVSL